uniref:Protein kinase domain-containing protein n=1 Tax=Tetradesmus obliquus TaxID=3088 RepID=A0A383VBX5_TETOB
MRNVVRAKLVCNPIDQALTSAKSFSNYPGFPPNNITMLNDICIFAPNWTDQVCFDDSVHFGSMAFLVRNTDPDAGFSWPGYVLYMVNTTRVCSYYISNQCYASFGQDTCIAEALNRLLNDTQTFQWTPGAIAGVATAAGIVVVVAVLCCVFRKRLLLCLVKISRKSLLELESNSSPTIDGEGTSSLILTSSDQNKKRSVAQTVRLGVLLGSGSFGRVYRGRWHGTDVAVKIISCTPDELPKVLKEAEVMMQLHHPNIVRAYQCSVWNPTEQQRALQAGKKAAAGAATPAQKASGRRAKADSSSQQTGSTSSMMQRSSSTGRGGSAAAAAAGGRAARDSSVVINIMPDIVLHPHGRAGAAGNAAAAGGRRGAAARQAAAASAAGSGTVSSSQDGTSGTLSGTHSGTVSGSGTAAHSQPRSSASGSSSAAGTAAAATPAAAAAAAGAVTAGYTSGGSSSLSAAARQLMSKVLHPVAQHQQQQQEAWARQQQQQQHPQAPSTRSWSQEGYIYPHGRFAGSPLSSAAPTGSAAGSSGGTWGASVCYYFPRPFLPAPADPSAASSSVVAGFLSRGSASAGQQLAPAYSSQGVHSAPLVEREQAGSSFMAAEVGASTAPTAYGSSGAQVLLPMMRGVPYTAGSSGSAPMSTSAVSPTAASAAQQGSQSQMGYSSTSSGSALAEGRDGSGGWWGVSSWRQQRQQALQQQAGVGSSSSATRRGAQTGSSSGGSQARPSASLRGSGGSQQQQQQQPYDGSSAEQLSSGAAISSGAAGAVVDPATGRVLEIQPAASGWWRRQKKRSSAGSSSADSQAPNSSSSIPVSGEQQGVAAAAAAAAAAATAGAAAAAAAAAGQPGDELLPGDVSSEEGCQEVQVWLVLELCTGGTLKDAVSMGKLKAQGRLEMAKLLCRLLDAATGMAYLHSKGVLHGDLKAGNVLLQATVHGTYGQVAKISDFGLAATLLDGATHRSTASMGTITHMAPEVLRSGHMSTAADVYSFGIMMWEVYTNQQAHQGLHYGAVVERVVVRGERPKVPTDMPNEYSLLMRSCWDGDAAKRPNFAQVITCLELLLDNLTSDSDGRISEGSEGAASTSSASGKGGNASGGNASSVKMEDLLARKSEPVAAAADADAAPDPACGKYSSGAGGSSAAAVGIAAGKPGGLLAGSSSSRPSAASGSGLGVATPGTSQLLEQRQQQLQMVSVPSGGKALLERLASGASTSLSHGMLGGTLLLGTSSRAGQTAGTWSSSLGGSGSMGSTLGVPTTPQQPGVQQQQQQQPGAWLQMGRLGLRQGQQHSSKDEAEADGGQLVQDL